MQILHQELHGPWRVDKRSRTRVVDECDATVATAGLASRSLEGAQELARFIAAAPEMYEALKGVRAGMVCICRLKHFTGQECTSCLIDAALAKAEGRAI